MYRCTAGRLIGFDNKHGTFLPLSAEEQAWGGGASSVAGVGTRSVPYHIAKQGSLESQWRRAVEEGEHEDEEARAARLAGLIEKLVGGAADAPIVVVFDLDRTCWMCALWESHSRPNGAPPRLPCLVC